MTPRDIKILLLKKDLTQTAIAREYGCTPQSIYDFVHGRRRSRGLAHFMASRLGVKFEDLHPTTSPA